MPEIQTGPRLPILALGLIVLGATGLAISLILTVIAFVSLEAGNAVSLTFGVPNTSFGISLWVIPLVAGAAMLAQQSGPKAPLTPKVITRALTVLVLGAVGWAAAFILSAEKVVTLIDPNPKLECDFSLLVQCGTNLQSWQGSLFGFPNPLLGLVGWSAVITVAVLIFARVQLSRWFWNLFNVGVAAALALVIWLIAQSIFALGTLCPWCMVTWAVTIPLFWMTTLGHARHGMMGPAAQATLGRAYSWTPLLTLLSYLAIAVIAQLRLDVLFYL